MSDRSVRLHDATAEKLAAELLDGRRPTPARVRALLQELHERRKEPVMAKTDPPPLPDLPDDDPAASTTERPTAEERLHALPDAAQRDVVKEFLGQYGQFDTARREELLTKPLALLRPKPDRIDTLSGAAMILLDELDPNQRDRVLEIATENGWPAWVVVLGAVARAADLQELLAGDFKPDWLNRPEKSEHVALSAPKCNTCGGEIPNARRGQTACCNRHGSDQILHTDGCALSYLQLVSGSWVDTRR